MRLRYQEFIFLRFRWVSQKHGVQVQVVATTLAFLAMCLIP